MKLAALARVDRNAHRLKEILSILRKYGLADWLRGLSYRWIQERMLTANGQRIGDLSPHVRIRLALTELGTTFIKLGQMLSTQGQQGGRGSAAGQCSHCQIRREKGLVDTAMKTMQRCEHCPWPLGNRRRQGPQAHPRSHH